MKRAATPAEINTAFEEARRRIGRPMTWEEIQALDAELARVLERPESDHEWILRMSEKLRLCGLRAPETPNTQEDITLYSFCAGLMAGQAMRIKAMKDLLRVCEHYLVSFQLEHGDTYHGGLGALINSIRTEIK